MSARTLLVLIRHLPEDSATVRAQRGTRWPELLYLLAYIADTVAYARADYATVHGGKPHPEPLPRPDTEDARAHRDQVAAVHDGLVDMMRGQLVIDAPPGDGRIYTPEMDTVG